ncbi:MAG: Rrf2 family transcriptional regulator [Lentisphaerae bacterium]|jgi:Rrf2 family protein|nr:Rrf2 family transcriptional regulator [Lentisphaerota bacterium]MBT4814179.1 Rrf2 family transcriptional regulator [Lentisphaerota bacterium]MBT5605971.1 Rrf2 family transcriptional regulator [Lentisphaerota bacterium]MBT7060541.1 Rrf2 family transcriptional regulator [Lentisphaerota bacterium]MBT7847994.1 Rrf2 family transcriptional regulator [Lentisphaerota bacterium]
MKLSTRGRYATRILLCIAREQDGGPVRKQLIADRERVSSDYVEQILVALRSSGLVNSHRGAKGGFTLARGPADITIWEVLQASEGPIGLVPCLGNEAHCRHTGTCVTRTLWEGAATLLHDYFQGVTLKELVEREEKLIGEQVLMYDI